MTPINCEFCEKFNADRGREWFDIELMVSEGNHTVLVPGVGAPCPGYLLLIARGHYASFLSAPPDIRHEAKVLLYRAMRKVHSIYGSAVAFEHGAGEESERTSGPCIEHAHIHVLPLAVDLQARFQSEYPAALPLPDSIMSDFSSKLEYLAYKGSIDLEWVYVFSPVPHPPSQYFRRRLFELLNRSDEYDYAVYSGAEFVKQTITDFQDACERAIE